MGTDGTASALAGQPGNRFVAALSPSARATIEAASERLQFEVHDVIFERGESVRHVLFPCDGAISSVTMMADGSQMEVGFIGREGIVGFPAVMTGATSTHRLYVQLRATALKVSRDAVVKAFGETANAQAPFFHYAEAELGRLSSSSVCNRLHTIDQRLAKWLLLAHDRVQGDEMPLTQEFLSIMLGVRRAGVTVAASLLQESGVIRYRRGRLMILDRAKLQAAACECYDAVEDRFEELMGYTIRKARRT